MLDGEAAPEPTGGETTATAAAVTISTTRPRSKLCTNPPLAAVRNNHHSTERLRMPMVGALELQSTMFD